jgi:hypothetical protein
MSSASRLQVVGQEEVEDQPVPASAPIPTAPAPASRDNLTAIKVGYMVANALSERFFAAFAGMLIPVLGLAGGYALTASVVAEPTTHQIGLFAVYGVFVLALVALRRK